MAVTQAPLSWDYDLKRILLGDKYDETEPIRNILNGKLHEKDSKDDYARSMPGHIENYRVVSDVFESLYPNGSTQYKDIMNSFWTTYKHYLQIEYSDVFMPEGKLSEDATNWEKPSYSKRPSTRYPPFSYGDYTCVGEGYAAYFALHFPEFKVAAEDKWFEFLLANFEHFPNVHRSAELNTFAQRTHTIGNICDVPKGFNAGRGASDYWDWALTFLREYLMTFGGWKLFVDAHYLNDYVNAEDDTVIPFWENHLSDNKMIPYYPLTHSDIQSFLKTVNANIRSRGERMMEEYEELRPHA